MASSSSNRKEKQHDGNKSMEMEEIVKYMSNLPSYLERGKPVQDRALNFGVLDWGRLEHWQFHHHQKPSVNTTNKCSPSGSKSNNRSSLNSHLNISKEEISDQDDRVSHSREKRTTNRSKAKPGGVKKNDLHPRELIASKSADDMEIFQTAALSLSSSKGKMKIQDESVNENGNFQDSTNSSDPETDTANSLPLKNKTVSTNNSKHESDSKRNTSITCHVKTPKEKECGVPSKNSDIKTGSKNQFSLNMNSKSPAAKTATRTTESPPVFQSQPEDSKIKCKVKMDLGNCKEVIVDNSCRNKTNVSSSSSSSSTSSSSSLSRKRALFQMAVKHGRPLFTFSVDENKNDMLAATVRSLAGKDDSNSWAYTFFSIQEVKKKKRGWLSHSSKDKSSAFLPNVTAEMTVSNPSICNGPTREFVLSSVVPGVDSGELDHQMLDDQLESELAAIVVRFLGKTGEDENQDCFGMTVILPGGHHSVPRKGEPSPLIQRWRSGGRCDCGGWDVGCRLRTLANNVQSNRRSSTPESFDLFQQGDAIDERPFFSLSQMKEGIFTVNYNASLPLLHAFSICISVIECRKSSHHTELWTYVAKRVDKDVARVTYASLPPVSPVGRV